MDGLSHVKKETRKKRGDDRRDDGKRHAEERRVVPEAVPSQDEKLRILGRTTCRGMKKTQQGRVNRCAKTCRCLMRSPLSAAQRSNGPERTANTTSDLAKHQEVGVPGLEWLNRMLFPRDSHDDGKFCNMFTVISGDKLKTMIVVVG